MSVDSTPDSTFSPQQLQDIDQLNDQILHFQQWLSESYFSNCSTAVIYENKISMRCVQCFKKYAVSKNKNNNSYVCSNFSRHPCQRSSPSVIINSEIGDQSMVY